MIHAEPRPYVEIGTIPMDFCGLAMREAVRQIGPAFVYDLGVSEINLLSTINTVREWNYGNNNPIAPHLNVMCLHELRPNEWFLRANGKSVGSQGYY